MFKIGDKVRVRRHGEYHGVTGIVKRLANSGVPQNGSSGAIVTIQINNKHFGMAFDATFPATEVEKI